MITSEVLKNEFKSVWRISNHLVSPSHLLHDFRLDDGDDDNNDDSATLSQYISLLGP